MQTDDPAPKPTFMDYTDLAFGTWSAAQFVYYFWFLYHFDRPFFGLLLLILLAPAAIAGTLLGIRYRKEILEDPAVPLAALAAISATLYLAALPFIFGGYDLFAYHLITEWKLYLVCVAAIVFIDRRVFPVINRFYRGIYRALHPLLPGKPPDARDQEPPAPAAHSVSPPPVRPPLAPVRVPGQPRPAAPPMRKPQPPAKTPAPPSVKPAAPPAQPP